MSNVPTNEIIRTKCNTGQLVITDKAIKVETKWIGQSTKMLSRDRIIGVDIMPYPKVLWIGGKYADLTFYGQGSEVIKAQIVKIDVARQIVEMLGY